MPDQQYDGVILEDKWGKTYLCSSCLLAYADLGEGYISDVNDKEYGRYFLHDLEPHWNLRQIWVEMYQQAKPWALDLSKFTDFQLRDALLQIFAAGEMRVWQLSEGWGKQPEGNGIGEGGLVMTGSSAPRSAYKKVLPQGGAAEPESIGVVDAAIGVVDLMATGLVNTGVDIVAGGAGLVTLAISGGDVDAAVHTIESVQENQVGPFTEAGEDVAKIVAPVVDEYYEQNMAAVGEKTLEVTDSPLLAMAAHKSVELVGTVMGAGVVSNAVKRAAKVEVDVPNNNPLTFNGGKPALTNDAFSPDVVNQRSAEFYELYGDNPLRGTLSNRDARIWYLDQEKSIPSLLDTSQPLSTQARQAFDLRNQFRTDARVMMQDRISADRLFREETNVTFENLVIKTEGKLIDRGLSNPSQDQIYQEIINSSQRSRQSVNKKLGL